MTRLTWRRVALPLLGCGLAVAMLLPNGTPAGGQPQPEAGSSDWRMVSAGEFFSCGIRTTGLLYCWGDDSQTQLGNGAATGNQTVPSLGGNGWNDWKSVSTGEDFACGLRGAGAIYCWGGNSRGQLGNGTTTTYDAPTPVQGANNYWTSVTAGAEHACGRVNDGRLFCWGANHVGQLGTGAAGADRLAPRPVAGGITDWTAVDAGQWQTCARRADGRLYCWGTNGYGQLGDGTTTARPAPRLVAGGITDWRSVQTAGTHTCALRTNGRIYCWGDNVRGQLGDGTTSDHLRPHLVPGSATWTAMAVGGRDGNPVDLGTTCARRSTGRLYCWGYNGFGGVGDGTSGTDRRVPTQVAGGATDWRTVTVGLHHTCATTTDSRAYCWGYNGYGQLASANFVDHPRPEEVWAGGSTGGNGSSGTTSGGSSGTTSGNGSSGTTSGNGSSGTTSGNGSSGTMGQGTSSATTGSGGARSSLLFAAVALALVAAGAVLIDGRRWHPLDGRRDAII